MAELGAEAIGSLFGFGMSPGDAALAAAGGSLASSGAFANAQMTSDQGYISNAPGSTVSQNAIDAQMSTEASLANLVSGSGDSINALGSSNAASDPSQGMVTPGGFVGNAPTGGDVSAGPTSDSSTAFGTRGTIATALQAIGLGGTSGTMGVGAGGLTDPISGMQTGIFGQIGFNPHASEMDIPAAPTPTVHGVQGHGTGVQGGNAGGTAAMGGYQGGHSGDPGASAASGGGGGGK